VQSDLAGAKIVCVYKAVEMRPAANTRCGRGFEVDAVFPLAAVINPTTAES